MTRCAVYRCFDAAGALLYVGASVNPKRRMREHRASKWSDWTSRVARVDEQWFESVTAARAAEGRAILTEEPSENVQQPCAGTESVLSLDPTGIPWGLPRGQRRKRRAVRDT